jgi:glycosyltransferase involved in cell wall biosynthesis
MTILFFARRFYPLIGGVEKHVLELSKELIKQGHQVIVITEHTNNLPKFESIKPKGLSVYRIKAGDENKFKKMRIWKELWMLRDVIEKANVVHCHDVFFWYLPFRFIFPKKKVFTTFHGYESYPISQKAIMVRKLSEKLSWGNICIGDFIEKWYKTKPTVVSYGAVHVSSKKQELHGKASKNSAVFVGRLDNQTGILTYVSAIELVREKYTTFKMTAVGDGIYKNRIAKKVNVVGFQNNPEKYFINSHFAFVSRYLAILEAFAANRLIFAVYDNPVKEDYLKMAPFAKYIVITQTADELRQKILYYLEHPDEEKKLIAKGSKWVKEQSWEKMAELYLKLWQIEYNKKKYLDKRT